MALTRNQLSALASARFADAQLLLSNSRYSSAYYLAGYAVEFGLKAGVARQVSANTIPDRDFFNKIFTHDFDKLIGLAGLKRDFDTKRKASQSFTVNWAIVAEWRPDVRYEVVSAMDCQLLVESIGGANDGVLEWIKQHW